MKHPVEYLRSQKGILFYPYPFPVGRLYIFGDERQIKLVCYGFELDHSYIESNFKRSETGEIKSAIRFLDCYLLGKAADHPRYDFSSYTNAESAVLKELAKVPFARTITYQELAEKAGIHRGARFAGNCMAKNKFPVFIPCHRVIKSDGQPGNYSSGVEIKRFLLHHEQVISAKRMSNG